ncbi:hypothetical protein KSP39_PZI020210 [Platanthera zijinensis]|uniref:Uncharacterized protein n=1 Tax=Platanthera zijinensis TaxID=2320716 RepID=A0AAP0FX21_9ASPA
MEEPRKPHLMAARSILMYVKFTSDMGLLYGRYTSFNLHGYTNADYGRDSDDLKSTSDYVFTCESTGISWCSKKHDFVSVSTMEAEYKTSTLAARETKHIEIEHHFIREKVLEGSLVVGHVRSEDNIADIFTKPLESGGLSGLGDLSARSVRTGMEACQVGKGVASSLFPEGNRADRMVIRALGLVFSISFSFCEACKQCSCNTYAMRKKTNKQIPSSSLTVLDQNPWREDSKPVFVLTQGDNQLCTMKTRQSRSEVERELGLLFMRTKRDKKVDSKTKHAKSNTKFNMFVEDIREGVLVFEDEGEASKYCELLQGGSQKCEGIAELEVSSVFDICQKMRALAVLFRRGRTPPLPTSLERNLRARKRSLDDEDIM